MEKGREGDFTLIQLMMWAISIIRKQLKALKHGTNQDAEGDGD